MIAPLHALAVAVGLILVALVVPLLFRPMLSVAILGYCSLSMLYSAALKRIALIDTLTIAALFTIRLTLGVQIGRCAVFALVDRLRRILFLLPRAGEAPLRN